MKDGMVFVLLEKVLDLRYKIPLKIIAINMIIMASLISCTHARLMREKHSFENAKYMVRHVGAADGLMDRCHIDLDKDPPQTYEIDRGEHGEFHADIYTVFYPEGLYNVLTHEYTHALMMNVSDDCKDELLARYAAWIERRLQLR
jgi:hypothetical protein